MQFMDDCNSFRYQYVDMFDETSINDLKKCFLDNLPTMSNFFIPLNLGITEFCGLSVTHSILIYAAPLRRSKIHVDYRADKLKLALNIPLKNCKDSITEFWNCNGVQSTYSLTSLDVPYNRYDINDCEKIDEFRLTQPVIFNTKVPHSVNNMSPNPRLAISLRFKEDPWHLVGL